MPEEALLGAREGIMALPSAHPDVDIFAAARDRQLNPHKDTMPRPGDYGDGLFGT